MKSSVDNVSTQSKDALDELSHIKINVSLKFNSDESKIHFYLPTLISTKFEYFMLGGIGDIKQSIDEETLDACKEIIATVGGGLGTTIKAQNYDDFNKFSFSLIDAVIIDSNEIDDTNLYKFDIKFNDEDVNLLIQFDDKILPFISSISNGGVIEENNDDEEVNDEVVDSNLDSVLSLLGENSSENLKLLFDVKLKFSVRLGHKTFLLKDIVNWDVGQIIELDQMVNEPLDILINNIKVGEGEAVIVEGRFGIKVKYIGIEN